MKIRLRSADDYINGWNRIASNDLEIPAVTIGLLFIILPLLIASILLIEIFISRSISAENIRAFIVFIIPVLVLIFKIEIKRKENNLT